MHIQNAKNIQAYKSSTGEIISELIGNTAGGTPTYSLAQIVLPPNNQSGKHYHPIAEESYYILSGTGQLEMDGKTITMKAGDTVAILPNNVHQIRNEGTEDLVFLAICVPAWTPDNSVFLD
jgi:mannose-6-phosphate isomerase-like protein (cupin superfamily)